MIVGVVFHNPVGTPAAFKAGVTFSMRRVLRLAIVLLGLQLSLAQVVAVGMSGLAIIAVTLVATFMLTMWIGRQLNIDSKLAQLIAAGTAICGASAVIATNTVTRASDEEAAYAIYTALPGASGTAAPDPQAFGLWAGASIHEIAQVVAAAFQNGPDAGHFGTIAKLREIRNMIRPEPKRDPLPERKRYEPPRRGRYARRR